MNIIEYFLFLLYYWYLMLLKYKRNELIEKSLFMIYSIKINMNWFVCKKFILVIFINDRRKRRKKYNLWLDKK